MKAFRAYYENAMYGDEIFLKDDYAYFEAPTRSEAVRMAAQYKKAWGVPGRAATVVEVPEITVFGRHDGGIVASMRCGEETMQRKFGMDAPVQEVYDFIQECIRLQDRAVKGGEE